MAKNFDSQVKSLTDQLQETLLTKNHDYGNSFAKSIEEYGNVVMCIRIGDKLNRLKTLVRGQEQQVSDESITDTLMDLAGYAILSLVEINKEEEK